MNSVTYVSIRNSANGIHSDWLLLKSLLYILSFCFKHIWIFPWNDNLLKRKQSKSTVVSQFSLLVILHICMFCFTFRIKAKCWNHLNCIFISKSVKISVNEISCNYDVLFTVLLNLWLFLNYFDQNVYRQLIKLSSFFPINAYSLWSYLKIPTLHDLWRPNLNNFESWSVN